MEEAQKSFDQTILYGKDIDFKQVLDAAKQYPLLGEKRVVLVREAQELKTLDSLAGYFSQPIPSTILVVAHKHKSLDKRKKYVKAFEDAAKAGKVGLFESKKLYDNQIGGWIRDYLYQRGYKSTDEANELLAQYLGNDLPKVSNELDKLMLNIPNTVIINPEHVKTNIGISKEFNVFELQDALGRKDQTKAYQISEYFCANPKDNPLPMLIGSLYGYFSKLYMLSFLKNSTDKEIEAETGIRQFFLKNYKPVLQKYNRTELEKAIHTLAHYDLRSKGIAPAYKDDMLFSDSSDYDTLLTEMVIKIMNPQ